MEPTAITLSALILAHSWYPTWCCFDKDCDPIAAERVTSGPSGYVVDGKITIPYREVEMSEDSDFHWCLRPNRTVRCFFAPGSGV